MFYVENAAEKAKELQALVDQLIFDVVEVYRGMAVAAFHYVALNTPQWSGNAAANWNFDLGTPTYRTDSSLKDANNLMPNAPKLTGWSLFGDPVAVKGDRGAVALAVSRNVGRDMAVGLVPVSINNAAEDLGQQYIHLLETNPNNYLRPENEPGHMVASCVTEFNLKLRAITPAQERILRRLRLGDLDNGGLL